MSLLLSISILHFSERKALTEFYSRHLRLGDQPTIDGEPPQPPVGCQSGVRDVLGEALSPWISIQLSFAELTTAVPIPRRQDPAVLALRGRLPRLRVMIMILDDEADVSFLCFVFHPLPILSKQVLVVLWFGRSVGL